MEQRLSIITLGVADIARTKSFYQALGWHPVRQEGIVVYNLHGMCFALYQKEALAEDAMVTLSADQHPPFSLAYNVSSEAEVQPIIDAAVNAGGKQIKPAQKVFWGGFSGYFADPDGFLWEVAYNPFVTLGEHHTFQWPTETNEETA